MEPFYHYVINASTAVQRRKSMEEQFAAHGGTPHYFKAVMGNRISRAEWERSVIADDKLSLAKGEVGCALSHVGIYKRLLQSTEPYVFVFEDDVCLAASFFTCLPDIQRFMDRHTQEPVVLLLYTPHQTVFRRVGELSCSVHVLQVTGGVCAHGYVVNRKAAENLVWAQTPVAFLADTWRTFLKLGFVQLYALDADLAYVNPEMGAQSLIDSMGDRHAAKWNSAEIKEKRRKALQSLKSRMTMAQRLHAMKSRVRLHLQELFFPKTH